MGASTAAASARTLYAADYGSNQVSVLPVSASGTLGTATQIGAGTSGTNPFNVVLSGFGNALYISNGFTPGQVGAFAVGSGGGLSAETTNPQVATGNGPVGLAVSPDGKTLYTADNGASTTSWFGIAATGSLSPATGAPSVATGSFPRAVAVSSTGTAVYVANTSGASISQYSVGAGGALTPMTPATISTGSGSAPVDLAVSPDGDVLYELDSTSKLQTFAIGAGGALVANATPPHVATGNDPTHLAVSPDGKHIYVANVFGGTVSQYSVGTNDVPVAMSPASVTVAGAEGITVSPDDRFVWVAQTSNTIAELTVGASGALTYVTNTSAGAGSGPDDIVASPDNGPTAAFTAPAVTVGAPTVFDSSGSAAGSAPIASQTWSFGDGTMATGASPTHTYAAAGTYTVTLTLADTDLCSVNGPYTGTGSSCALDPGAAVTQTVTVNPPPSTATTPTTTTPGTTSTPGTTKTGTPVIPPPSVPTPTLTSVTEGGTTLALRTPAAGTCLAPSARYTLMLSVAKTAKGGAKATSAAFYLDRGVAHTRVVRRHGKRVKVTRYVPNATTRKLPATVTLSLAKLKSGSHALKVVVAFRERRHRRMVTVRRTLHVPFRIC